LVRQRISNTTPLNIFQLIIKEQHGFVPKKSCISNLLETLDLISQAIEQGYPIDIIFLDFAKAFDTVAHKRLGLRLFSYGFLDKLLNWIKAFISNRLQIFSLELMFSNHEEQPKVRFF
jgi:hypothetical protein